MSRQPTRRTPKETWGFSWGRIPMGNTGVVAYNLFRRDHTGKLHHVPLHFYVGRDRRADVAVALRAACHQLRDKVDTIYLAAVGLAA